MLKTSQFILNLFILFVAVSFTNAGPIDYQVDSCWTPNNTRGNCLRLSDCEPLLALFDSIDEDTKTFLKESQCGFHRDQQEIPKKYLVCCPDDSTKKERIDFSNVKKLPGDVLPTPDACGQALWNRIYGGVDTEFDEYPWIALVVYSKPNNEIGFDCAGSLINNRYVLTAAHCVNYQVIPDTWNVTHVRLGEYNLKTAPDCSVGRNGKEDCAPMHKDIPVEKIIYHENYFRAGNVVFNDIALIRMKESVEFTDFIYPICLPLSEPILSKSYADVLMEIAGWGATEESDYSSVKRKAVVKAWPHKKCEDRFATLGILIQAPQICAGGENNTDTCRGDSGGPLMAFEKVGRTQTYFAVGVVSYGPRPCAKRNWPGIYTRVGLYMPWIKKTLKP